jgi:hypothetical protein
MQYYSWDGDTTGRIIVDRVMKAADRGVKVRLLVDDPYYEASDSVKAASMPTPMSRSVCSTRSPIGAGPLLTSSSTSAGSTAATFFDRHVDKCLLRHFACIIKFLHEKIREGDQRGGWNDRRCVVQESLLKFHEFGMRCETRLQISYSRTPLPQQKGRRPKPTHLYGPN